METEKVWYAAYGSNIFYDRFLYYIKGGKFEKENGTSKYYPKCEGDSEPSDKIFKRVNGFSLIFGNESGTWIEKNERKPGVAFIDEKNDCSTFVYMKYYLISRLQFEHCWEQEVKSPEWYGKKIPLTKRGDIPVYTFSYEIRPEINKPSDRYLTTIIKGLKSEGLEDENIIEYMIGAQGVGRSKEQLIKLLAI